MLSKSRIQAKLWSAINTKEFSHLEFTVGIITAILLTRYLLR